MHTHALETTKLCAYPPLSLLFKIQKGKGNVGPNGSVSPAYTYRNKPTYFSGKKFHEKSIELQLENY